MSDFQQIKQDAEKRIQDCRDAPDWANQDNILAKVEAIRLRAYREILALGFEDEEVSVHIALIPQDMPPLFRLAKELKWLASKHGWCEPACEVDGGSITIYFEPSESE